MKRRIATLLVVVGLAGTGAGVWAYFSTGAVPGSLGRAAAGTLEPGNTPDVSLSGRDVTLTWPQSSPSDGYTVARYAGSGGAAATVCGRTASLTCTDTGVPTGHWTYTVTPHDYDWTGAESNRTAEVVVAPAAPVSVTFANGPFVNIANEKSVEVDVLVPETSLASDTVQLAVSDGSNDVTASASPPVDGSTTIHLGLDVGDLVDGPLTFTANSTSSYGDDSTTASRAYSKDTASPAVTVTPSRPADHSGWYNHAVAFSASAADVGGVEACDPSATYSGPDGTGLAVSIHCTDRAGNTGTGTSAVFDYDATSPTVPAPILDRPADSNGWYNRAVTWTAPGTDVTSGIESCESSAYGGPEGAALTVARSCTDKAGNTASAASPTFKYDATVPTVTVSPDRSTDSNGWYNNAVTFTPFGADVLSGVSSCQPALVYSAPDGTGLTVSRTCTDDAGNVGTGTSANFKYDGTGPTVALNPDRNPDLNGWYNHGVTFTPSAADVTSGIASCQSALLYVSPDGTGLTVSRTCTNNAGGTSTGTSAVFKFDRTPPVVTAVTPERPPDSTGWYNHPVVWTASGTDALSGIASCQSTPYSGDSAAVSTSRSCTDNAGVTGLGLSPAFKYDATKPVVRAVIVNSTTSLSGYLRQGGTYVVYAEATDLLSGPNTASLTADVAALSGQAGVPLTFSAAGFTVTNPDGSTSTYHYKSAQLTAQATLAEGATGFTVAGQDVAANVATTGSGTSTPAAVTVDNTSPTAAVTLAAGQASSTATQPINFAATFTEAVTALAANGITLGGTADHNGATITFVRTDSTHYSISITGLASSGTVTVAVSAAATSDLAGNPNPVSAAGPAVTFTGG